MQAYVMQTNFLIFYFLNFTDSCKNVVWLNIERMATDAAIISHFQMAYTYISFSTAFRLPRSSKVIACSRAIKISDYEFAPERPSAFGDCTSRYIAPLIYICEAPVEEAYLSIYSTVYVPAVWTLVRSIELCLIIPLPCVLLS